MTRRAFVCCLPPQELTSRATSSRGRGLGGGTGHPQWTTPPLLKVHVGHRCPEDSLERAQVMGCPAGVMDGDLVSGLQDRAAMSPGALELPCPGLENGKGLPVGLATLTPGQETSFLLAPWWASCILPVQEGPPPSPLG